MLKVPREKLNLASDSTIYNIGRDLTFFVAAKRPT